MSYADHNAERSKRGFEYLGTKEEEEEQIVQQGGGSASISETIEAMDAESLDKSERLDRARSIMAEGDSIDLQLEPGELEKVGEDIIVEKTDSGFITYIVDE